MHLGSVLILDQQLGAAHVKRLTRPQTERPPKGDLSVVSREIKWNAAVLLTPMRHEADAGVDHLSPTAPSKT